MYIDMCIYTRCTGERAYDIEYSEYEVLLYICRYVQHITTICVYVFNCPSSLTVPMILMACEIAYAAKSQISALA